MEHKKENSTHDRELIVTRTLDAPIDLVWEVWSQPQHICQWWGPTGFTCTIQKMDVKPGGEWLLILHGPDGKNYDNKSVFTEIEPLKKIVYEHTSYPPFVTTIEFEAQGEQTFLTWRMLFESAELLAKVVKTFGADEGLKQNIIKLQAYLQAKK